MSRRRSCVTLAIGLEMGVGVGVGVVEMVWADFAVAYQYFDAISFSRF